MQQRQANKTIEADFSEPGSRRENEKAISPGSEHSPDTTDHLRHINKKQFLVIAEHRGNTYSTSSALADRALQTEGVGLIHSEYMVQSAQLAITTTDAAIKGVDTIDDLHEAHIRQRGEDGLVAAIIAEAKESIKDAHAYTNHSFRQAGDYLLRG